MNAMSSSLVRSLRFSNWVYLKAHTPVILAVTRNLCSTQSGQTKADLPGDAWWSEMIAGRQLRQRTHDIYEKSMMYNDQERFEYWNQILEFETKNELYRYPEFPSVLLQTLGVTTRMERLSNDNKIELEDEAIVERKVKVAKDLMKFINTSEPYKRFSNHRATKLLYLKALSQLPENHAHVMEEVSEIIDDYDYPQYDTITGRLLINILIETKHLSAVFDAINKCQLMEVAIPYQRVYVLCLEAGQFDRAIKMAKTIHLRRMDTVNTTIDLGSFPLIASLEALKRHPSLFNDLLQVFQLGLKFTLSMEAATLTYDWFKADENKNTGWVVRKAKVRKDNRCSCCNHLLQSYDTLSKEERFSLKNELFRDVVVKDSIYKITKPETWTEFDQFLTHCPKIDAVLDIYNIRNWSCFRPPHTDADIVEKCKELLGPNLLIICRGEHSWRRFSKLGVALFCIPIQDLDDPFMLFAALNFNAHIVSGDNFRDHSSLLSLNSRNLFYRYQMTKQLTHDTLFQPEDTRTRVQTLQECGDGWHIPVSLTDVPYIEQTGMMLCMKRKFALENQEKDS